MSDCIRKFPISELNKNLLYPIDVFICCSSYENRCRTVANNLWKSKIRKAIIVENRNLHFYVGENTQYLRQLFGNKTVDAATDSRNSIITADGITAALSKVARKRPRRFLIDVTTFRHESLLILLHLLSAFTDENDTLLFAYNTAADYSINEEVENKWLSKGVADVRTVLGYTGRISPYKKMHLVILVGFEYQRASRLIEMLEPSVLSLGHGSSESATEPKHLASQNHFYDLLKKITAVRGNVDYFEFACNNPIETIKSINSQMMKYPDHNVVVAPMNTKLSTIGAGLAAFEHPEIQVCYAEAEHYNYRGYSAPGPNCYLFQLDLPTK